MEAVVIAAVGAVAPTIAALASWRDMRKRTNGQGPIAEVLREHGDRLTRIEERSARTEERTARMERYLATEARAKRRPQ